MYPNKTYILYLFLTCNNKSAIFTKLSTTIKFYQIETYICNVGSKFYITLFWNIKIYLYSCFYIIKYDFLFQILIHVH